MPDRRAILAVKIGSGRRPDPSSDDCSDEDRPRLHDVECCRHAHRGPERRQSRPARPAGRRDVRQRDAPGSRDADLPVGPRPRRPGSLPADEPRGRVRRVLPRRARRRRRDRRQSRGVDALRVGHPRRPGAVRRADRRGSHLGRRQAGGVEAAVRARGRPYGEDQRQGRRRLPGRAGAARREPA